MGNNYFYKQGAPLELKKGNNYLVFYHYFLAQPNRTQAAPTALKKRETIISTNRTLLWSWKTGNNYFYKQSAPLE